MSATRKLEVLFLGDSAQLDRKFVQVSDSAGKFGKKVDEHSKRAGGALGTLSGTVSKLGLAVGGLAVGSFFEEATHAALTEEQAHARLATAMRNTTHASQEQVHATEDWLTKQALATGMAKGELFQAFSRLIVVTHNGAKAQQLLSTSMNIAAARGIPLQLAAQAVGKAYLGQTAGLKKLGIDMGNVTGGSAKLAAAQKGVQAAFTGVQKAQQKLSDAEVKLQAAQKAGKPAAIAAAQLGVRNAFEALGAAQGKLTDSQQKLNRTQGAGAASITALNKAFAGQAAKQAETTAGKMARLRVRFEEIQLQVGQKLLPVLSKLADLFLKHQGLVLSLIGAIAGFAVIATIVEKFKLMREVVTALNATFLTNPVFLVIAALVALGVGLVVAYNKVKWFRTAVQATFAFVRSFVTTTLLAARQVIVTVVGAIVGFWTARFGWLRSWAKSTFDNIRLVIQGAMDIIRGIIKVVTSLITGDWSGAWHGIQQIFSGVWSVIRGIVGQAIADVRAIIGFGLTWVAGFFSATWDGIVSFFAGIPGRLAAIGHGMWDFITGAFKGAINAIIDVWNSLHFKVPSVSVGPVHFGGETIGLPQLPHVAAGGVALARPGGILANLAEAGHDEAIVPLPRNWRTMPHAARGAPVVVHNHHWNVTVERGTHGAKVGREIFEYLKQFERSSGPLELRVAGVST